MRMFWKLTFVTLLLASTGRAELALVSAFTFGNTNGVDLFFNETVPPDGATDPANYELTAGLTSIPIESAQIIEPARIRLTAPTPEGFVYTVKALQVPALAGPAAVSNQVSFVQYEGYFTRELYLSPMLGTVDLLTRGDDYFRVSHDSVDFSDTFSILENEFTGLGNDFGIRIRAYLTPLLSGIYEFTAISDDQSKVMLSLDDLPANKQTIIFIADRFSPGASPGIPLVAGNRYYMEAILKCGGAPNYLAVSMIGPGIVPSTTPNTAIPFKPLLTPAGPAFFSRYGYRLGPVALVSSPQSRIVEMNKSVEFSAAAEGALPHRFQWFKNGDPIPEATSNTLHLASVSLADDQSTYHVEVSNEFSSAVSAPAKLTVEAPVIPPLTIRHTEGVVTVSWNYSSVPLVLETNSVVQGINWVPIDESVYLTELEFTELGTPTFFRLKMME